MKKYISLLSIALTAMLLAACSENKPGCFIEGNTTFNEYHTAYLVDEKGTALDSITIDQGKFSFERTDCSNNAYMAVIRLESNTPADRLEMPVAVEDGIINLKVGEYIHTSGTPLNKSIQEFLDSMQHCKDALVAKEGVTAKEINKVFSEFYKQQILNHKNNVLGEYILKEYGSNMLPEDYEYAKAQLGS